MAINRAADFEDTVLKDWGVTVSRTPVTTTFTGNGNETRTNGTPANITAHIHLNKPDYSQNEEGLFNKVTGYIMVKGSETIFRNDILTYNSIKYRVTSVTARGPGGSVAIYKYCEIVQIE